MAKQGSASSKASVGKQVSQPVHPPVTLSRSALMLSPCIYWAGPDKRWEDDRFKDTTNREHGTSFHAEIERWLIERL